MTIEIAGEKRLLTARLDGELDHRSVDDIRNEIEKHISKTGVINVALDFSNVIFMDSSGIGFILGRYKTVRALGGRLILFGMSREIERIVKMSGIDKIAEIY